MGCMLITLGRMLIYPRGHVPPLRVHVNHPRGHVNLFRVHANPFKGHVNLLGGMFNHLGAMLILMVHVNRLRGLVNLL